LDRIRLVARTRKGVIVPLKRIRWRWRVPTLQDGMGVPPWSVNGIRDSNWRVSPLRYANSTNALFKIHSGRSPSGARGQDPY
jgi:hypothetical protein